MVLLMSHDAIGYQLKVDGQTLSSFGLGWNFTKILSIAFLKLPFGENDEDIFI